MMNNTSNRIVRRARRVAYSLACLAALSLGSCAEDITDEGNGDSGAAVSFNVSNAQDEAQAKTRAAGSQVSPAIFASGLSRLGLSSEDLTAQKLAVTGAANTCLIETTTAGIYDVKQEAPQTRANISAEITANFSSFGYRGAKESDISGTPWFYNKETTKDGKLVEQELWSWSMPYAKFYGISPLIDGNELTVSPKSYDGTPYINYTVNPDVTKQKDLMTACSGVVHYATKNVAPATNLSFRHALTAVCFKVGQNLSYGKTINKVEIVGAKSKGKYTLPTSEDGTGASWSELTDPTTFTLSGISVKTSEAVNNIIMGKDNDNFVFYMIPQELEGVSVNIYFEGVATPATAKLKGSWKAGTTKTYAISEKNSDWGYEFAVTSPVAAAYDATTTGAFTVKSYRQTADGKTQVPVPWQVVGYDANGDGTFSLAEKPAWLTSLSKTSGDGSTTPESCTATLKTDIVNNVDGLNNAMKNAEAVTNYDLSTKGGTVARTTANCYVISAPGSYRIPLVYGNAIKDGKTNSSAYQASATGEHVLQHFKDHAGVDISSPWITLTNNKANVPDGAKIVWADEKGLVTGLAVSGSGDKAYVDFQVPKEGIKSGNAVIAVTKGGTVIWSWHLWFAPQGVLQTVACTNFQGTAYSFTQQNLGYKFTALNGTSYLSPRTVRVKVEQTYANGGEKKSGIISITQNSAIIGQDGYNTFYQFGRKDAFPGTDDIAEGSITPKGGDNMSIQNGIQNPGTFYTYGKSWYEGYNQCNLWSMENKDYVGDANEAKDEPVVKTIYDPCPAGFKMPGLKAFTGASTTGKYTTEVSAINASGKWSKGWYFNNRIQNPDATAYFPATGDRDWRSGSVIDIGDYGLYWTAIPGSNYFSFLLEFGEDYVYPFSISNAFCDGFTVRPVKE